MGQVIGFLISISVLFSSGIALASVFPEGSHRAGLQDEFDKAVAASKDGGLTIQSTCQKDGYRLWSEYTSTFDRVSDVQAWCGDLLIQFNINVDLLFDHCGWSQAGRYGNYTYNATFLYYAQFPGAPRFYFEQYSCDGNGGYTGGGGY